MTLDDLQPPSRLPRRIDPCPIVEAILEVRFERPAGVDFEIVPGTVYAALKPAGWGAMERLPAADIPRELHEIEPTLKYSARFRLPKANYLLLSGPCMLALSCQPPYPGWERFKSEFLQVLASLQPLLVQRVVRVGVRYIAFLTTDLFGGLRVDLNLAGRRADLRGAALKLPIEGRDHMHILLQLAAGATSGAHSEPGSLLDVDVSGAPTTNSQIESMLESGHDQEKQVFFALLKDELLASLNPEY